MQFIWRVKSIREKSETEDKWGYDGFWSFVMRSKSSEENQKFVVCLCPHLSLHAAQIPIQRALALQMKRKQSINKFLTPHPSPLTPHPSPLIPHPSPLTPHSSLLTPHSSLLTPHPSPLTPHPSPLTPHPSPLTLRTLSPHPLPLSPLPSPLIPLHT